MLVFRIAELKQALQESGLSAAPPKAKMQERLQRHLKMVNEDASAQAALYALTRRRIPGRLLPMPSVHDAVEAAARKCPKIPQTSCLLNQEAWDSLAGNGGGYDGHRTGPGYPGPEGSMPAGWAKFRCVCSASREHAGKSMGLLAADPSLRQCAGGCGAFFHKKCMGLKTRTCEMCRLRAVDPFWENVAEPGLRVDVGSAKLSREPYKGEMWKTGAIGSAKRTFRLTSNQKSRLATGMSPRGLADSTGRQPLAVRLRVACFMLEDSVVNRVHWPLGAELLVNGYRLSCYSRYSNQDLGPNGRDACIDISSYCRAGENSVQLRATQENYRGKFRDFVMVVQMGQPVSLEDLERKVRARCEPTRGPGHADGVARAKKILGVTGGGGDDDDVVATSTIVPLRCPLSAQLIQTPARSRTCSHLKVFDMHSFLLMNLRSQKWQCPFCMGPAGVGDLEVDFYLRRVLNTLGNLQGGDQVEEIEVRPSDMAWRAYYGKHKGGGKWVAVGEAPGPDTLTPGGGGNPPAAKPEPGGAPPVGAAATAEPSESSELSEREEMRRAAAAARGLKRPRPVPVIDLSDSEEVEEPPKGPSGPAGGGGTSGRATMTEISTRGLQEAQRGFPQAEMVAATYTPSHMGRHVQALEGLHEALNVGLRALATQTPHNRQATPLNLPPRTAPQPPLRTPAPVPRQGSQVPPSGAAPGSRPQSAGRRGCNCPTCQRAHAAPAGAGTASNPLDL